MCLLLSHATACTNARAGGARPLGARLGALHEGEAFGDYELLVDPGAPRATTVVARGRARGGGDAAWARAEAARAAASTHRRGTTSRSSTTDGGGPGGPTAVVTADESFKAALDAVAPAALAATASPTLTDVIAVPGAALLAAAGLLAHRVVATRRIAERVLAAVPELADWAPSDRMFLAAYCAEVPRPRPGPLYRSGDRAGAMYILTAGAAVVSVTVAPAPGAGGRAYKVITGAGGPAALPAAAPRGGTAPTTAPGAAAAAAGAPPGATTVELERISAPRLIGVLDVQRGAPTRGQTVTLTTPCTLVAVPAAVASCLLLSPAARARHAGGDLIADAATAQVRAPPPLPAAARGAQLRRGGAPTPVGQQPVCACCGVGCAYRRIRAFGVAVDLVRLDSIWSGLNRIRYYASGC
jgi:hypothetical protein